MLGVSLVWSLHDAGHSAETWGIVLYPLLHEKTKGIIPSSAVLSAASPGVHTRLTHSLVKCNRRYPCSHCTQRRRPELCAYYQAVQVAGPPLQTTDNRREENMQSGDGQLKHRDDHQLIDSFPESEDTRSPSNNPGTSSLAELFGYFEDSKSNTMALLRKVSFS